MAPASLHPTNFETGPPAVPATSCQTLLGIMASIDDIFKARERISSPPKPPWLSRPDHYEAYKASKLSANGSNRRTRDEHGRDDGDNDNNDDGEAGPAAGQDDEQDFGPAMPPGDEEGADGDDGDDEEGRFFGGGISKQESRILDFVDEADEGVRVPDKMDAAWLRKTMLNFEKHITRNAELRAKYEDDPQKFIGSEADLDADIKGLSILSDHPELYPELVRLGSVQSLVGLLAHENTDIAIDVMEVIGELTDEDVSAQDDEWDGLVDGLMEADLVGLLVSNLSRLNEDDEADRSGVYHALGIIENLCSRSATAARIGQQDALLKWLLERIQRKEGSLVSQNKQYAAEILAILSQASPSNAEHLASLDAVDTLLRLAAPYRKRDPDRGGEEEEYMQDLFEALTCMADQPLGKSKFVDAEGVELCLIMLKEGKRSRAPALRLLDHAASTAAGSDVCIRLVEAGGLKGLFTLFTKTQDRRLLAHLVAIFASMLRLLPAGEASSAERIRTLAKFVERDYEKTAKLVRLRGEYAARVRRAEQEFAQEEERRRRRRQSVADASDADPDPDPDGEIGLLSRRLDAGLFTLQQIDVTLAWLVAEDAGAGRKIRQLLAERGEDLTLLAGILSEQQRGLDTSEEDSRDVSDMLGTLIRFLQ
ncbi:hypothetical protein E4U41_000164 [Claviceps citrina]|nr:hypothetical protein E4U41_000164 [Claviceps citrina]